MATEEKTDRMVFSYLWTHHSVGCYVLAYCVTFVERRANLILEQFLELECFLVDNFCLHWQSEGEISFPG